MQLNCRISWQFAQHGETDTVTITNEAKSLEKTASVAINIVDEFITSEHLHQSQHDTQLLDDDDASSDCLVLPRNTHTPVGVAHDVAIIGPHLRVWAVAVAPLGFKYHPLVDVDICLVGRDGDDAVRWVGHLRTFAACVLAQAS